MNTLATKFMGVEIKNPIIVGASNLVTDIENVKRMEKAGAAAIVYKSLFEEQIQLERLQMHLEHENNTALHAEMLDIFPKIEHAGPREYIVDLKKVVESVNIPVFASLNAVYDETWIEYAKEIEKAGVAGIELNFYYIPKDFDKSSVDIENSQLKILKEIKSVLKIPVSVKLSPFYSNALNFIKKIDELGADSVVLFNSLFQPDIDIETEKLKFPYNLSSPSDYKLALRYAGLLYGNIKADISANGGVFSGEEVIKLLLAGADSVQIVSTLYKNKIEYITDILAQLETWMKVKGYQSINDFKGKVSRKNLKDPYAYKRAQYIDILLNSDELSKVFPV